MVEFLAPVVGAVAGMETGGDVGAVGELAVECKHLWGGLGVDVGQDKARDTGLLCTLNCLPGAFGEGLGVVYVGVSVGQGGHLSRSVRRLARAAKRASWSGSRQARCNAEMALLQYRTVAWRHWPAIPRSS